MSLDICMSLCFLLTYSLMLCIYDSLIIAALAIYVRYNTLKYLQYSKTAEFWPSGAQEVELWSCHQRINS